MVLFKIAYICIMKYAFIIFAMICFAAPSAYTQILNGGFEDWTGELPDHWAVSHTYDIHQSSEAHSGKHSIQCTTCVINNYARGLRNAGTKLPFGMTRLSFWYKAKFDHFDWYGVATVGLSQNGVAGYWSSAQLTTNGWTKVTFDFGNYTSRDSTVQDSIAFTVQFAMAAEFFNLDDVTFEAKPNDVDFNTSLPLTNILVFPNPVSFRSNLKYQINGILPIHASIFDVAGREVMKLPSVPSASGDGSIPFDVDDLPNGLYYLRFEAGGTTEMRKIIIQH